MKRTLLIGGLVVISLFYAAPASAFTGLYGDFTDDNTVNMNDLPDFCALWLVNDYNQTAGVDLNGDHRVNFYEFSSLANNWQLEYSPTAVSPQTFYIRQLTVNNITNQRSNEAIELTLDSTFDWSDIDSKLSSLRFYDSDNVSLLDYWVESLNYGTSARIWVRVPTVTNSKYITMQYSNAVTTPYRAESYTAHLRRPAGYLNSGRGALQTYPTDINDVNLPLLHPCVTKAVGWQRYLTEANAVAGQQNVFWVMVNTSYPQLYTLKTNWSTSKCENPALWICTDPNGQNGWRWPPGVANWPQDSNGTTLAIMFKRVDVDFMPDPCSTNLLAAPPQNAGNNWRDPTSIVLPTGVLRVYADYSGVYYYIDINSTNTAWSSDGTTGTIRFGSGSTNTFWQKCKIGENDFTETIAKETGHTEVLNPTVLIDSNNLYWMFIKSSSGGQKGMRSPTDSNNFIISRWNSSDGITWTKVDTPVIPVPTGMIGPDWHDGACIVGNKWFLMGSSGPNTVGTATKNYVGIYMWESEDNGATWNFQYPACLPMVERPIIPDSNFGLYLPYRVWPVYDVNYGLMVYTGVWPQTPWGDIGGVALCVDSNWTGATERPMPNINSVFWLYGVDFNDPYCLTYANTEGMKWPEQINRYTYDSNLSFVFNNVSCDVCCPDNINNYMCTGGQGRLRCQRRYRGSFDPNITSGKVEFGDWQKITAQKTADGNSIFVYKQNGVQVGSSVATSIPYGNPFTAEIFTDVTNYPTYKVWVNTDYNSYNLASNATLPDTYSQYIIGLSRPGTKNERLSYNWIWAKQTVTQLNEPMFNIGSKSLIQVDCVAYYPFDDNSSNPYVLNAGQFPRTYATYVGKDPVADACAYLITNFADANGQLRFDANPAGYSGAAGNNITIKFMPSGTPRVLVVGTDVNLYYKSPLTPKSTDANCKEMLDACDASAALLITTIIGDGNARSAIMAKTNLSGGADAGDTNTTTHARTVAGIKDRALRFDGITDYVDCKKTYQDVFDGNYTIAGWFKTNNGRKQQVICGIQFDLGDGDNKTEIAIDSLGRIVFLYQCNDMVQIPTATTPVVLTTGENGWHHIAAVAQQIGSSVKVSLYFDGVLSATDTKDPNLMLEWWSTYNFYLGAYSDNGDAQDYFSGSLDDVRIYNKALNANEVAELYLN